MGVRKVLQILSLLLLGKSKESPASGTSSSNRTRSERGSGSTISSDLSHRPWPWHRSNESGPSAQSDSSIYIRHAPATKRWKRLISHIRFRHVLMGLITISVVFSCCTAVGLRNIYLLSLSYSNSNEARQNNVLVALESAVGNATNSLEVRVGFIGICVNLPLGWTCSSNARTVANRASELSMSSQRNESESYDQLGLIDVGRKFRDEVMFDGLLFVAIGCSLIAFCLLYTFSPAHLGDDLETPEIYEQSSNSERRDARGRAIKRKHPVPVIRQMVLWFTLVAAVMSLLSVFWQHLGSAGVATMIRVLAAGEIKTHLGSVSMGLGWTTVVINAAVFLGWLLMILSIRILSQLSD
ncbi:hypothetical protein KVR01_012278 [Diaporthe batatas]|uniref:uncharacterized protein n=1 Tax=Diaporthe batatas TaxID=748121 RepID=UPI001D046654|nr:uncharacterized protein KVR01_012278 [Diaporthe batatas]KAG8158006.1 hypothetical protein KVR01_012278 [Diaporthe batatas]